MIELTNKIYKGVEEYIFHFDYFNTSWFLIDSNMEGFPYGCLMADFLDSKNIQLPDDCTYCYYVTDCAKIKFREHGTYIHIYYEPIKHGQNSKNRN